MALNNAPDSHWAGYFRVASMASGSALVPPAYTTDERDALADVPEGAIIRNSDTNKLNVYLDGAWEVVTSA